MRLFRRSTPQTPRARFRAGTQALNAGRYEEAVALLTAVCNDAPDNLGALLNLGLAYHRMGQHTKAIQTFERVHELNPREPRAYLNRAAAENALGHLDKAEQALLQALEISPRQVGVHYNLAVIHLKRNQYANAMAEMELELAVNPGHRETEIALRALRERLMLR